VRPSQGVAVHHRPTQGHLRQLLPLHRVPPQEAPEMTAKLKAWGSLLAAAASLVYSITTALEAQRKQANDFEVVKILAAQLAEARGECQ
jgi:hypothetical protein